LATRIGKASATGIFTGSNLSGIGTTNGDPQEGQANISPH
jgi:hypothetical protein